METTPPTTRYTQSCTSYLPCQRSRTRRRPYFLWLLYMKKASNIWLTMADGQYTEIKDKFAGTWKLDRSENFEEFLQVVGKLLPFIYFLELNTYKYINKFKTHMFYHFKAEWAAREDLVFIQTHTESWEKSVLKNDMSWFMLAYFKLGCGKKCSTWSYTTPHSWRNPLPVGHEVKCLYCPFSQGLA